MFCLKKESGIQVNNFIKETIEQLSSIFKLHNKKIDFTTELANNFTADIDIFLTKRVINNLILNALSYSANSDKIDIFLKHTDNGFYNQHKRLRHRYRKKILINF